MFGWELPAPVSLARGTRLGNLDPKVYTVMTGLGLWKSPSGTWGRLLCASACILAFILLLCCSGILLCVGSSGSREPGFSAAGGQVARLPTWLLVHTLGAVDRERMGSFLFALTPLDGAAALLGAGGEVGASDGMIAVAMSRVW